MWGLWSLAEPAQDVPPPVQVAAATPSEPDADAPTGSPSGVPFGEVAPVVTPAVEPTRAAGVPMPASSIGTFTPNVPREAPPEASARMAPPATEDATQQAAPKPPAKTSSAWRSAIPMPEPEPAPRLAAANAVEGPAAPAVPAQAEDTPEPSALPLVRRGPTVAPGSPPAGVAALRTLPKSDRDRPPLEGVGVSGIHVDRLDLGSAYDDGVCLGSNRSYAVSDTKSVNVCFRAVHRRQTERVLVKWSKNGRLLRRAWIVIPAAHAYRTRAGLRLRDSYVGNWTVTVESSDGIVLASGDFKVSP